MKAKLSKKNTLLTLPKFLISPTTITENVKKKKMNSKTQINDMLKLDQITTHKMPLQSIDVSHAFDLQDFNSAQKDQHSCNAISLLDIHSSVTSTKNIERANINFPSVNRLFEKHLMNIYKSPGIFNDMNSVEQEKKKLNKSSFNAYFL